MALLNRCFLEHLPDFVRRDSKGRFFFVPNEDMTDRVVDLGGGPEVGVASKKNGRDGGMDFWVHRAAWISFMDIGESLFLRIEPGYVFTTDGLHSMGGRSVGQLAIQWTGKERNAAVVRQVMFWSRFLRKGKRNIVLQSGGDPIVVRPVPATGEAAFGIEGDHIGVLSLVSHVVDDLNLAARSADNYYADDSEEGTSNG